jgi:branched-chain amino acid transport system permease protein
MDYLATVVVLIGLFVILAVSFDLIIGHCGLISIAHPIFYAIGAYVSAVLAKDAGVPIPLAILAGGAVAFVSSALVALPSLRVSGDYLLIASIGFQLGLIELAKHIHSIGGAGGLTNIPAFLVPSYGREAYALLVVALAALTVLFVRWLTRGPYGRMMAAMRDDELAFSMLGRNAIWVKVSIFAIGSGIAGVAGGLYAHYFRFLEPDQFGLLQSSAILTMVVVGGMRTTWGPVIGAVVLQVMPQAITFIGLPPSVLGPLQGLLFSGLVLVFMFARPQGLLAAADNWSLSRKGGAGRD